MHKIDIDKLPDSINILKYIHKHLNKKNLDICFVYKSKFTNTKLLRVFIENIILNLGISKTWIPRFILITDELNNNAIEYGSRENDINYMRVKIEHNHNSSNIKINIEVEDSGKGKNHKSSDEMNNLKKEKSNIEFNKYNSIRGRGLFLIINKLVDKLYFKDSGKGGLIVGIDKKLELT